MQRFNRPLIGKNFLGYNDTLPPHEVPPYQLVTAQNVRTTNGKIEKVSGTTSIAAQIVDQVATGLTKLEIVTTGVKYIVASMNGATNAAWYQWSGSGAFTLITGSDTLTNNTPFYFETALNVLYGFNGVEVGKWDGTTFTRNPATIPLGYFPAWFHNYLFVARTATYPNRLFWSNIGDPTTFNASNFVDINPGDGDQIMGLQIFQDELLVFKKNTIWSITGFSGATFSSTTINSQNTNSRIFGYGCLAPGSIVTAGDDVYFMSFVGDVPHIRSLRKTTFATTIEGGTITGDLLTTMQSINKNVIGTVQAVYDGRYVKWALPTGANTLPDTIIELDTYNIKAIKKHTVYPFVKRTGLHPHFFTVSTISGSAVVYFIDWFDSAPYNQGIVYKFNTTVYTDLNVGNEIIMDVVTPTYLPDPARKLKWKYLYIRYDSGQIATITVKGAVDSDALATQATINLNTAFAAGLDSFRLDNSVIGVLGGDTPPATTRVTLLHLTGKMAKFEFYQSSNTANTIYDYELYYQPKGLRNN